MKGIDNGGFTLIEVLVAMVLLGFAVMGVQAVITDQLIHDVGREDALSSARHLVDDRLQTIQADPRYSEINTRFAGTESSIPYFSGYRRQTLVDVNADHTVVTVEVVTPVWNDTVDGTAVVGMP